jgi:hypothetical protein
MENESSFFPPDDAETPAETPEQEAAAAEVPDKLAVEAWAERRGMLPMELRAQGANGPTTMNPEYWKFAGTRALKRWADGQLVTEAEFDAAVAEQLGLSHR